MKAIAINKQKKVSLGQSIILLLLSIWALTTIYPIIWVVLNSFKDRRFILSNSFALPLGEIFTLDNYRLAFERVDILSAYKNSLLISTSVAAAVILLAGLAAYVLARYEFRLKKLLYNLVIAGMMFPVFSTIIPVFQMQYSWGIVNTSNLFLSLLSTALPQIAGNLSFAIVVLMGYIKSIPIELEEAAYIEGANIFQIFFRVIVPLTKPSFATVAIFSFLWSYNDLFTQMFFLRTKTQWAITVLLNQLTSQEGTNYGLMAAAVTLVVIPILIVYIFLQKYIIKGMISGAIKG
ncbi:carbohydrate ABC transporter permease [Faecalicatena contorta]|uniref:Raffinose/stachyose/melibiose transport system permease protein n=1 Tax=Faecalicatena contorta TaxID=39482 RepID=A0A315ZZP3_9FIRM|nr:carbohydrate ABC transporter permease [Faecalicatena contorta]PWJ50975.1 raffinose/stachyose/melibiose transport system permease protein [Faecalicatena contorta]SUQ13543.1 raffinose/stachyose/melibiose transport system permease protein [Faecalicatena contorta]